MLLLVKIVAEYIFIPTSLALIMVNSFKNSLPNDRISFVTTVKVTEISKICEIVHVLKVALITIFKHQLLHKFLIWGKNRINECSNEN